MPIPIKKKLNMSKPIKTCQTCQIRLTKKLNMSTPIKGKGNFKVREIKKRVRVIAAIRVRLTLLFSL